MNRSFFVFILSIMLNFNVYGQARSNDSVDWKKEYRASREKKNQLIHTKLSLKFNYATRQALGEEWLTAKPYFYDQNELVLDAKAMDIHKVSMNGKSLAFDYDGLKLKIPLDKTYNKNESYQVYINYTANPEKVKQKGSAAINDAKGLYFVNPEGKIKDKPTQIWTQGQPESNSCWFPTIDSPNQKSTEEIILTVPDKYVTLSNGKLISQKNNSDGTRTDHWKMDLPNAQYLFFFAVGDYAIVKDSWRGKPVNYYVEKPYEKYAREIYGNTPEMMTFFSNFTGVDYPWSKFSQISARDYISGAMENTTAVLHQNYVNQNDKQLADGNRWEDVIAHELFHHWFGDYVTCESWANLTLNESFAVYSEYLWREYKYGRDHADAHLDQYVKSYKAGQNYDKKLVRFYHKTPGDMFDAVSYNKGGAILHMLRNYLGDKAFRAGIKQFLTKNKLGTVEAQQLRLAFEAVSGKDLNWFFNEWYYGSGHPKFNVTYDYNAPSRQVLVTIEQTQDKLFKVPVEIGIYKGKSQSIKKIWVTKKQQTFKFDVNQKPDLINFDNQKVLLMDLEENKTPENYAYQYSHVKNYRDRKTALNKTKEIITTNPAVLSMYKKALHDPYFGIRKIALSHINLNNDTIKKELLPTIEHMAKKDKKNNVRAAAINLLASLKSKKYLSVFKEGLNVKSAVIPMASLNGLYNVFPDDAIHYLKEHPQKIDKNLSDFSFLLAKIVIEGKIESQMENIAPFVGMYLFIQGPNGTILKNGFDWLVGTDDTKATQNMADALLKNAKIYKKYDFVARIIPVVNEAIKKKQLLYEKTKSKTVAEQIAYLQKTIDELGSIK